MLSNILALELWQWGVYVGIPVLIVVLLVVRKKQQG